MLRILARDAAAQQTVLGCLGFKDLFALMRSCSEWREWIQRPAVRLPATLSVEADLDVIRRCFSPETPWLGAYIASVTVKDGLPPPHLPPAVSSVVDVARWLPQAGRVHSVKFKATFNPDSLLDSVSTLSASLTRLDMSVAGWFTMPLTQASLDALLSMPLLRWIRIDTANAFMSHQLEAFDLSRLLSLRYLTHWTLQSSTYHFQPLRVSPAQLAVLTQCRQLTSIAHGSWDVKAAPLGKVAYDPLTLLLDGRKASNAPPLCHLDLSQTFLTPAAWQRLQRVSTLTELEPTCWITEQRSAAEYWTPLREFSGLQALVIRQVQIDSTHFLPPILHCKQLTRLHLSQAMLDADQMAALFAACPLTQLRLRDCVLGNLSAFAGAVHVSQLSLWNCTRTLGGPLFASTLPALPRLQRLTIYCGFDDQRSGADGHTDEVGRITRANTALVEPVLRRRMPQLGPKSIDLALYPFDFKSSPFVATYSEEEKQSVEWNACKEPRARCSVQ